MKDDNVKVPRIALQLLSLGEKTEKIVKDIFEGRQKKLFSGEEDQVGLLSTNELVILTQSLINPQWNDDQASKLISLIIEKKRKGEIVDFQLVGRWILSHYNDADSVGLCLNIDPPSEIEIIKVLSRKGSQKIVFLGMWRLTQREVVVKQLKKSEIAERELESFPLTLSHPNIIETYRLQNRNQELFLIENRLYDLLSDEWRVQDIQEATNFLYDIGCALKYVHDNDKVHGDIKPDNIGKRHNDYILLDFGICRPVEQFIDDVSATGSLRTRAPELFLTGRYEQPQKVDVWALGASLFLAYKGRYPFFKCSEPIPRVSNPDDRQSAILLVQNRISNEWGRWVEFDGIPEKIKIILQKMLEKEPQKRINSEELVSMVYQSLPAFLRGGIEKTKKMVRFSPKEELRQIDFFLSKITIEKKIPQNKADVIKERLKQLETTPGFSEEDKVKVQNLFTRLG